MTFTQLKDLIPKAAGKFQLQGELHAALIVNRASSLIKDHFPENLVQYLRVKRFKEGVLWIAVQNAIAAQEIQQRSDELKEELNSGFDKPLVQKIRTFQETPSLDPQSLS